MSTSTISPASHGASNPLLWCGVAASIVYVVTDLLGAMYWQDYSYRSQTISELMGLDAPSRPLVVGPFLAHGLLTFAFGVGVRRVASRSRALRLGGLLLMIMGIVDLSGPFVPIHLRGAEATLTDTLHVVVTSVLVLLILTLIGLGAVAFQSWFRLYSIATLIVLGGAGIVVGTQSSRLTAQEPTPWLGIAERTCVFSYLLWALVLAAVLLYAENGLAVAGQRQQAPGQ